MTLFLWLAGCGAPSLDTFVDSFLEEEGLSPADCGSFGFDAEGQGTEGGCAVTSCFAAAVADCTPTMVEELLTTVEGDPIPVRWVLYPLDDGSCVVQQFLDTTADAFGANAITEELCTTVEVSDGTCPGIGVDGCTRVDCVGSDCD